MARNIYQKLGIALLGTIFQIMLHGCAILPEPAPVGDVVKSPGSSPANNLLQEAKQEMRYGRYDKAEILAERALRMESHNPGGWQVLGRIKAAQNNYSEAIQFYKKSNSLAGNDVQLLKQNEKLIEDATGQME